MEIGVYRTAGVAQEAGADIPYRLLQHARTPQGVGILGVDDIESQQPVAHGALRDSVEPDRYPGRVADGLGRSLRSMLRSSGKDRCHAEDGPCQIAK